MVAATGKCERQPILVVDDDEAVRDALQVALEMNGYVSVGASDGARALSWLRDNAAPGLILLDLMMPVMDGWALMKALAADERFSSIPVVVLTAFGRDLGSAAERTVLRKPVQLAELLRVVRQRYQAEARAPS
jgi:CheY-like chemotaxis protein